MKKIIKKLESIPGLELVDLAKTKSLVGGYSISRDTSTSYDESQSYDQSQHHDQSSAHDTK